MIIVTQNQDFTPYEICVPENLNHGDHRGISQRNTEEYLLCVLCAYRSWMSSVISVVKIFGKCECRAQISFFLNFRTASSSGTMIQATSIEKANTIPDALPRKSR